jgi:hypothetical protein
VTLGLQGITFTGGYYETGGAVGCWGELPVVIANCIFQNNVSTDDGGAIWGYMASPEIRECHFEGNSAERGGAVFMESSTLRLRDCTFAENISTIDGGALYLELASTDTVEHCTFAYNEAPRGTGLSVVSAVNTACFVDNCIIAFGGGGRGLYWNGEGNFVLACCDIFGNEGGDWVGDISAQLGLRGNLEADPIFCGEMNPDKPFTLASESPCAPEANPACGLIGAQPVGCTVTQAPDLDAALGSVELPPSHPNPFCSFTTIGYELKAPARVGLRIFSVSGRLVRVLVAEEIVPTGRHERAWNGTDTAGRVVSAGVYFLSLKAGGITRTQKIVRVKK